LIACDDITELDTVHCLRAQVFTQSLESRISPSSLTYSIISGNENDI